MENKTGKPALPAGRYFKYAIGEIILVVIGILIALQINNWNELKKENAFEQKVLSELLMDVKEDLGEMKMALDSLQDHQNSIHIVINHLKENKVYNNSLDNHFANSFSLWSLSPNTTAFDMAKEEGMYMITNDSIRFNISKANGYIYDYIKVLESRFQDYKSNVVLPHILPLFESYNFQSMKPRNYDVLINDETFEAMIKSIIPMRERYIETLQIRYKLLEKLELMIQSEIDD
jgi:hypothetical protein